MKCTIFMGENDIQRQRTHIEKIKLLGAEVRSVEKGTVQLNQMVYHDLIKYLDDVCKL